MNRIQRIYRWAAGLLLTAALTLTPALALTAPEVAADWYNPFPDVEETGWYFPYVAELSRQELVRGYDNGNFGPLDEIRAGDSIILVVRTAGGGDPEAPKGAHYAQGYIDLALERKWVEPEEIPEQLNGSATRLFIARMAARALGVEPAFRDADLMLTQPSPFVDTDDAYVTALFREGIVEGTTNGEGQRVFNPDTSISRAELTTVVWRMLDWQENQAEKPGVSVDSIDPTDPTDPNAPEDPDSPGNPADPNAPEDPDSPGNPADPNAPEDPDSPEDPADPNTPAAPDSPDSPEDPADPNAPEDPDSPGDAADPNAPEDPDSPEDPADPNTPAAPDEPEAPKQIPFGNKMIDVLPDVPVNPYDPKSFSLKNGRMSCSMENVEVSFGVDVSSHQGVIDWNRVAADGVEFAYIRAGGRYYGKNSGTIFSDALFRANLKGAMDAGIETGAYFFSQAISVKEAREEAQFILEQVKGTGFNGPIIFDWENIGTEPARTDSMKADDVTACALEFCRIIEDAGYQPMIYFNRYIAYELYNLDEVDQYPFWIADYNAQPTFYYGFTVWQYSSKGNIAGIRTGTDVNVRLRFTGESTTRLQVAELEAPALSKATCSS